MEDIHKIGGIPAILKYLLNNTDLIDGSQLSVTGKTIAENFISNYALVSIVSLVILGVGAKF